MTSPEVLIVEDEAVVLLVAGKALAAHDISCAESRDFEGAAAQLSSSSFKVVLTDLKLPGTSGFEVIRLAAALSPPPPVITVTGYATIETILESFRLGSFDFLPKPFDVDELMSVVERAMHFFDRQRVAPQTSQNIGVLVPQALRLGNHSWALIDADGTATLGAGETLAGTTASLTAVETLGSEDETVQGRYFCRLLASDGRAHRVRAPLSGRILTRNPALETDPGLVAQAPFTDGWLARIIPNDLQQEGPKLGRGDNVASG